MSQDGLGRALIEIQVEREIWIRHLDEFRQQRRRDKALGRRRPSGRELTEFWGRPCLSADANQAAWVRARRVEVIAPLGGRDAEIEERVRTLMGDGFRITAIRLLRERFGCSYPTASRAVANLAEGLEPDAPRSE